MSSTFTRLKITFLLVFMSTTFVAKAQEDIRLRDVNETLNNNRQNLLINRKFVFGASIAVTVEFGKANTSQYRFSLNGGVSKVVSVFSNKNKYGFPPYPSLMPALQTELIFFRGGLGTSQALGNRGRINLEMRNQFSLTLGKSSLRDSTFQFRANGRPLAIFMGNSNSVLVDPYDVSVTIGSVFINRIRSEVKQQVGGLTLGVHPISINYSNEGPIFRSFLFPMGDGYDRWWTGGGRIAYFNLGHKSGIHKIDFQYDKFTGWQPNCYETARRLGMKVTPYIDANQALFNQSRYLIAVTINNNFTAGLGIYDARMVDFQNMIHSVGRMPIHQTQLKRRYSGYIQYRLFNTNTF